MLKTKKSTKEEVINYVKEIYKPFTPEKISEKITALLKPSEVRAEVEIIYQNIENLHSACPNNTGDWYFTGNYPTPEEIKLLIKHLLTGKKTNKLERIKYETYYNPEDLKKFSEVGDFQKEFSDKFFEYYGRYLKIVL